jgi:hypothetical protein
MTANWRSDFPVLVTEGQTLGAIAVTRSLGRAGYPVHVCAPVADALGLQSRYASESYISPKYENPEFLPWIRRLIDEKRIKAIIPSEGFLLAIRPHFAEFSPLLPYSPNEQTVYAGMSKVDQISRINAHSTNGTARHLPPFLLIDETSHIPVPNEALVDLGCPLYIKTDGCYATQPSPGLVYKANSLEEAATVLVETSGKYKRMLVEGHVPGRGVGSFFLLWNREVRAEFMHIRVHEVPHTGGVSSYRKSWWHEGVREDALRKLKALDWQGVAMMEYRWDETRDQFYFMEMNGRFWGSLHLALHGGVDFPTMLLDLFHGREPTAPKRRVSVSSRHTFPSEVAFVRSRWKDRSLSWPQKMWSAVEFLLLGLNPLVRSDLWFRGDTGLYWKELTRFLRNSLFRLASGSLSL